MAKDNPVKMTPAIRGTTEGIRHVATEMGRDMTPAEARLWSVIRSRQLDGLRFRAQHPLGRFVFDFYCPSCRLVVEVYGGIHDLQPEYDAARTEHLTLHGYHVVTCTNDEVFNELPNVLKRIKDAARTFGAFDFETELE